MSGHLRTVLLTAVCVTAFTSPLKTAGVELSRYRGLTLGDSVPTVIGVLDAAATDVKVLSLRPSLVEQLTWRPLGLVSGTSGQPEALAEMVLTFHLGKLARIAVVYDRERTAGLTETDLRDALSAVYGTAALVSTAAWTNGPERWDRKELGRWEDAGSLVVLWRDRYPERVGLILTAIAADKILQETIAEGARLDRVDAPARELARRVAEAKALQARNDKLRLDNKAAFKP